MSALSLKKKHFLTFATSREPSYISRVPCAVITTATGAGLSCACNDTLPPETRGCADSAPHFAADFCRFLSHPEVDLLWPQKGSKTIIRHVCAEFTSESKPKIEDWLHDDLRPFFFSFSKFSPIYHGHHPALFQISQPETHNRYEKLKNNLSLTFVGFVWILKGKERRVGTL